MHIHACMSCLLRACSGYISDLYPQENNTEANAALSWPNLAPGGLSLFFLLHNSVENPYPYHHLVLRLMGDWGSMNGKL